MAPEAHEKIVTGVSVREKLRSRLPASGIEPIRENDGQYLARVCSDTGVGHRLSPPIRISLLDLGVGPRQYRDG